MVTYDKTTLNKIEFMLPNDKMASLKLVTLQQQNEINNSIKCYTGGKNCISWSMVGVVNAFDIINAIERQQKLLKDSYFNKMIPDKHFTYIDLLENSIIFELDGIQMSKLNSAWDTEIANELEKHNIFHHFESVMINRKNKNKNDKRSHNNTNTNKNDKKIDIFDSLLVVWDMEINNIQNESKYRDKEICKIMIESFDSLTTIQKINAKMDSTLKMNHAFDIKLHLKQMRRDGELDSNLNQDILNAKNNISMAVDNLLHQEIERKERNETNERQIKHLEMNIQKMNALLSEKNKDFDGSINFQKQKQKQKQMNDSVIVQGCHASLFDNVDETEDIKYAIEFEYIAQ